MTTSSAGGTPHHGPHADDEPTSERADAASAPASPYDIGLAADEDETGPKPLDTDLEDQQVRDAD